MVCYHLYHSPKYRFVCVFSFCAAPSWNATNCCLGGEGDAESFIHAFYYLLAWISPFIVHKPLSLFTFYKLHVISPLAGLATVIGSSHRAGLTSLHLCWCLSSVSTLPCRFHLYFKRRVIRATTLLCLLGRWDGTCLYSPIESLCPLVQEESRVWGQWSSRFRMQTNHLGDFWNKNSAPHPSFETFSKSR